MYRPINGFTVAKIKETIRARNNGKVAGTYTPNAGYVNDLKCQYLTADGNRCAVGCFIPDGHPAQGSDAPAHRLLKEFCDLNHRMPLTSGALEVLQHVHDSHAGDGDVRDVLCAWIDKNVADEPAEVSP